MQRDEMEIAFHLSEKKRQLFEGLSNLMYDSIPDVFESKKLDRLFVLLENYRDYQSLLQEAVLEQERLDALFAISCAFSITDVEGLVDDALAVFEDNAIIEMKRVVWNVSDQSILPSAYIAITEFLNYQSQLTELIAIYLYKSKQCLAELVSIIESLDDDAINFLLSMMMLPQYQEFQILPMDGEKRIASILQ